MRNVFLLIVFILIPQISLAETAVEIMVPSGKGAKAVALPKGDILVLYTGYIRDKQGVRKVENLVISTDGYGQQIIFENKFKKSILEPTHEHLKQAGKHIRKAGKHVRRAARKVGAELADAGEEAYELGKRVLKFGKHAAEEVGEGIHGFGQKVYAHGKDAVLAAREIPGKVEEAVDPAVEAYKAYSRRQSEMNAQAARDFGQDQYRIGR